MVDILNTNRTMAFQAITEAFNPSIAEQAEEAVKPVKEFTANVQQVLLENDIVTPIILGEYSGDLSELPQYQKWRTIFNHYHYAPNEIVEGQDINDLGSFISIVEEGLDHIELSSNISADTRLLYEIVESIDYTEDNNQPALYAFYQKLYLSVFKQMYTEYIYARILDQLRSRGVYDSEVQDVTSLAEQQVARNIKLLIQDNRGHSLMAAWRGDITRQILMSSHTNPGGVINGALGLVDTERGNFTTLMEYARSIWKYKLHLLQHKESIDIKPVLITDKPFQSRSSMYDILSKFGINDVMSWHPQIIPALNHPVIKTIAFGKITEQLIKTIQSPLFATEIKELLGIAPNTRIKLGERTRTPHEELYWNFLNLLYYLVRTNPYPDSTESRRVSPQGNHSGNTYQWSEDDLKRYQQDRDHWNQKKSLMLIFAKLFRSY